MSTQQTSPYVPPETLGIRLERARRDADVGVQEMADYLGVARNTVSTWLHDRIRPGDQTLRLWAMRCGVSYDWLKTGELPFPRGVANDEAASNITCQYDDDCTITGWRLAA